MPKGLKIFLKVFLSIVLVIVLVVVGYFAYVLIDYDRIEDNLSLKPQGTAANATVNKGGTYTVVTQNLGFGAYSQDFTFFMDGGTESWGRSVEEVTANINAGAEEVKKYNPDFILFQEVDFDSTRSYHIRENDLLAEQFEQYAYIEAVNYHSAFLMYPLYQPHGSSYSEIMTMSRYSFSEDGVRRSLPISTGLSKLLDLDRCYSKSYMTVDDGHKLVLYNVHLSAYGHSDDIRTAQMTMLFDDMKKEYENGNYCVCGGDFNHDFTGTSLKDLNPGKNIPEEYDWAQPFPEELLPACITRCTAYSNDELTASCRNCDKPYEEGDFTVIVDGFLVTSNVKCVDVKNTKTGFTYSDHSPVVMQFTLGA